MAMRFYTLTAPLDGTAPQAPSLTEIIKALVDASPDAGFEVLVEEVLPAKADPDKGATGAAFLAHCLAAKDWLAVDAGDLRLLAEAIAQPVDISLRVAGDALELVIEDGDTLTLRAVSAAPVAAVAALLAEKMT